MSLIKLYEEISKELEDAIIKYMRGEINVETVCKADLREKLFHSNWNEKKAELKNKIHESLKEICLELNEVEKNTKILKDLIKENKKEINMEDILSHAMLLGRNRNPPQGAENSQFYLPPFPNQFMTTNLNK
ncbi:hypothetical protein NUSPORA_01533 [Nucleospora cyclopteri]